MYSQSFYKGTAIAIYKFPDSIVASADRKISRLEPSIGGVQHIDIGLRKRKLINCGKFWIAFAGFVMDSYNNFNMFDFADSLKQSGVSVDEAIHGINDLVEKRLINLWTRAPRNIISELRLEVAFFHFNGIKPFAYKIKFSPEFDPIYSNITIKTDSSNDTKVDHVVYLLGSTNGVIDAMKFEQKNYTSLNEVAYKTIEAAIDIFPQFVDGPIDLLVINKDGFSWDTKNYSNNSK